MKKPYGTLKKLGSLMLASGLALFIQIPAARADSPDDLIPYLQNIQTFTLGILVAVDTLPVYLNQIATFAMSMMATDNSPNDPVDWSANWTNQQTYLSALGTDDALNESMQYQTQVSLLQSFWGQNNLQAPNPPNLNDLSSTSLWGYLLVNPDPRGGNTDPATNYIVNASGLGMPLTIPAAGWRGDQTSQKAYLNFYNAVTAVQTYNAFVLGRLYADGKSATRDFPLRMQLLQQSTASGWFSSIIGNDLGWVLRQILLYTSQNFVLMDQMVQTQKQIAATLAMTNTLIIASNQMQASVMLKSAQGS